MKIIMMIAALYILISSLNFSIYFSCFIFIFSILSSAYFIFYSFSNWSSIICTSESFLFALKSFKLFIFYFYCACRYFFNSSYCLLNCDFDYYCVFDSMMLRTITFLVKFTNILDTIRHELELESHIVL